MIFFLMISEPHKTKRTDMTFPYPKLCRSYDGRGIVGLPIDELQSIIRDIPKPVIARINGFAIGGGNVFATLCDLSIMADTAKLGQVGPKVDRKITRLNSVTTVHLVCRFLLENTKSYTTSLTSSIFLQ